MRQLDRISILLLFSAILLLFLVSFFNFRILGKGVVPLAQLLKRECESLKCQVELYDLLMSKLESVGVSISLIMLILFKQFSLKHIKVKLFLNIEYKGPREITNQGSASFLLIDFSFGIFIFSQW
jgi:amino acid transporter